MTYAERMGITDIQYDTTPYLTLPTIAIEQCWWPITKVERTYIVTDMRNVGGPETQGLWRVKSWKK